MSTGYTPGAGYYQSPHSYQGKPMTTFTSPASPHHGVPSGMVSNTSISPGPSAHYAPQYGLSVQSIVDPTTGRGITALSQVNPTLRSPHHTLVQDKETGVIDNTVAGISSRDVDALHARCRETVDRLRLQVDFMMNVANNAPRTLFQSRKLKFVFTWNSCASRGEVLQDGQYAQLNEASTRKAINAWRLEMDDLLHRLNFEANGLMQNERFYSELNKLAARMKETLIILEEYQPCHCLLAPCYPRAPYNGCKKLNKAANALLNTLKGIGNIKADLQIQQEARHQTNKLAMTQVNSHTDRRVNNSDQGSTTHYLDNGEVRGRVAQDMYGNWQVAEGLPQIEEHHTVIVPPPERPLVGLMMAPMMPVMQVAAPPAYQSGAPPPSIPPRRMGSGALQAVPVDTAYAMAAQEGTDTSCPPPHYDPYAV